MFNQILLERHLILTKTYGVRVRDFIFPIMIELILFILMSVAILHLYFSKPTHNLKNV